MEKIENCLDDIVGIRDSNFIVRKFAKGDDVLVRLQGEIDKGEFQQWLWK